MKKICLIVLVLMTAFFVISCDKSTEKTMNIETYEYQSNKENPMGFDLYMPDEPKGDTAPLLIYIHGGSWIQGSKESVVAGEREELVTELLEAGYAIASFDYSLIDEDNAFPKNIEDCIEGINYIIDNHESLKIDVNNIGLWGSSAGGHLSLLAAQSESLYSKLDYVIDYFGPTELVSLLIEAPQATERGFEYFFGKEIAMDKEKLNETAFNLSPINQEWPKDLPLLIVHGDKDEVVPLKQSQDLYDKFMTDGAMDVEIMIIEDGVHSLLNNMRVEKSVRRVIIDATKEFIYKQYEK